MNTSPPLVDSMTRRMWGPGYRDHTVHHTRPGPAGPLQLDVWDSDGVPFDHWLPVVAGPGIRVTGITQARPGAHSAGGPDRTRVRTWLTCLNLNRPGTVSIW
jgi:hypothetical protein